MIEQKECYEKIASDLVAESTQDMYGVDDVIRLCLVALYTNGHVLLEGNPGLGKTELVKTLGRVLLLPYGRIQFTPDLMPSDITGTLMPAPNDVNRLTFQHGPVFTSLLLADEINRATPKTQAAMLEAMAERQVTVLGVTHKLGDYTFGEFTDRNEKIVIPDKRRPFMVLATQNPVDQEGTYDLPEAQSDRFMFKILMPVPSSNVLVQILRKTAGLVGLETVDEALDNSPASYAMQNHKESVNVYEDIRNMIKQEVSPTNMLRTHITNLFLATNNRINEISTIDEREKSKLREQIRWLKYGLGPRAASALLIGAKAWTFLFSEDSERADGLDLAKVIIPALRHRIRLTYGWESGYREKYPRVDRDRWVDYYLADLCTAAAPTKGVADGRRIANALGRGYKPSFEQAMRQAVKSEAF